MKYNPDIHRRRSIRLKPYDYGQAGAYFITICAYERTCLFGNVTDGVMQPNIFGKIVNDCWEEIPIHYPNAINGISVVMPNHFHGIIHVGAQHAVPSIPSEHSDKRARHAVPLREQFGKPIPDSIPTIVRSFKSAVTKRINQLRDNQGAPVWQRNYYEHVIRNENEYKQIAEYIVDNPRKWQEDSLNPNFIEQKIT